MTRTDAIKRATADIVTKVDGYIAQQNGQVDQAVVDFFGSAPDIDLVEAQIIGACHRLIDVLSADPVEQAAKWAAAEAETEYADHPMHSVL